MKLGCSAVNHPKPKLSLTNTGYTLINVAVVSFTVVLIGFVIRHHSLHALPDRRYSPGVRNTQSMRHCHGLYLMY